MLGTYLSHLALTYSYIPDEKGKATLRVPHRTEQSEREFRCDSKIRLNDENIWKMEFHLLSANKEMCQLKGLNRENNKNC